MNEKTPLPTRGVTLEDMDDADYVKSVAIARITYKFFLRTVHENFTPCQHCMEKLHKILAEADDLYLGNNAYEPAIELHRFWETDDESWKEVDRHPATEKDYIEVYGSEKGPRYWKQFQEILKTEE